MTRIGCIVSVMGRRRSRTSCSIDRTRYQSRRIGCNRRMKLERQQDRQYRPKTKRSRNGSRMRNIGRHREKERLLEEQDRLQEEKRRAV